MMMRRSNAWLIVLVVVFAGCRYLPKSASYRDMERGEGLAIATLTLAADPVLPSPDQPSPDDSSPQPGQDCPWCEDGRSGDGLGKCNNCGGDGRIDEEDLLNLKARIEQSPPVIGDAPTTKRIAMHVTKETAAGWPQVWWRNDRVKLESQGWTVQPVRDDDTPTGQPWFEVTQGGVTYELHGPQPLRAFQ